MVDCEFGIGYVVEECGVDCIVLFVFEFVEVVE